MKVFGFGLVVPIFDLTREKLLTLPVVRLPCTRELLTFHHFALGLIAPYRAPARKLAGELIARVRALWARRSEGANEEAR